MDEKSDEKSERSLIMKILDAGYVIMGMGQRMPCGCKYRWAAPWKEGDVVSRYVGCFGHTDLGDVLELARNPLLYVEARLRRELEEEKAKGQETYQTVLKLKRELYEAEKRIRELARDVIDRGEVIVALREGRKAGEITAEEERQERARRMAAKEREEREVRDWNRVHNVLGGE